MVGFQTWDAPAEAPAYLSEPGDPWVLVTCLTDYQGDEDLARVAAEALRGEPYPGAAEGELTLELLGRAVRQAVALQPRARAVAAEVARTDPAIAFADAVDRLVARTGACVWAVIR